MTDSDLHLEHLHDGVAKLRPRGRQLPDRYLLVAGGVLVPLGLVLIVIGWYGSAQTTLDFEQTPYLISGGILGLALVFTGGLLYFSFWLTQLVRDGRTEALRTQEHHARVELALARIAAAATTQPKAAALVVTAGGSMLHRPECAATDGQVTRKAGNATRGLTLCGLCRPEPPAHAKARA
jgi:hypothetical protein